LNFSFKSIYRRLIPEERRDSRGDELGVETRTSDFISLENKVNGDEILPARAAISTLRAPQEPL
jgi:hypothetical protein